MSLRLAEFLEKKKQLATVNFDPPPWVIQQLVVEILLLLLLIQLFQLLLRQAALMILVKLKVWLPLVSLCFGTVCLPAN